MKSLLMLFILFWSMANLSAQKEDYIWVIGDSNNPNTTQHGGMIIDFNYAPPKVSYQYRELNIRVCSVSYSDSLGQLLFYSNGCDIADANDEILPNGDELNPGYWHNKVCDENGDGYAAGYPSMVILPLPDHDSLFYLFHKSVVKVDGPPADAYVDRLLYTVIKVTEDEKTVVEKNIPVMEAPLALGEMLAVKHANGKDWWLMTPKRNSNRFYVFRFTDEGIVDTLTQTIGALPPPEEEGSGQTTLSPDGSLLVRYFPYHPIILYDFDRANGTFSNYRTVDIELDPVYAFDGGAAISPNGRFLYIMAILDIYQFDLWADDISSTQTLVAEWDGFLGPLATVFAWSQLGPDCKIYIQCGDMRYYHIIHNPDEPGLACNVEQRGLVLPTPSGASIPYFPNYRLGPPDNPGLPCTPPVVRTGPGILPPAPALSAWPNPATEQITLAWSGLQHGEVIIAVFDVYGRPARQVSVAAAAGRYSLSVVDLPPGIYHCSVSDARAEWKAWATVAVEK